MTQTTNTAVIRERQDSDIPALAAALVEVHQLDGYPVEGVDNPKAWLQLHNAIGARFTDPRHKSSHSRPARRRAIPGMACL